MILHLNYLWAILIWAFKTGAIIWYTMIVKDIVQPVYFVEQSLILFRQVLNLYSNIINHLLATHFIQRNIFLSLCLNPICIFIGCWVMLRITLRSSFYYRKIFAAGKS